MERNEILKDVQVKVPQRSGFNKSFKNTGTGSVGTLIPIVSDLLVPNTDFDISIDMTAQLPPLASDTFMRCSIKTEAFMVPLRLLYKGFEDFITNSKSKMLDSSGKVVEKSVYIPKLQISNQSTTPSNFVAYGPGSLADYLGYKRQMFDSSGRQYYYNPLKFMAYHKIYDDWYRNPLIQNSIFISDSKDTSNKYLPSLLPSVKFFQEDNSPVTLSSSSQFIDGTPLYALRQRNFGVDYFTNATPLPQRGTASSVTVPVTDSEGKFSIAALRAANSIQQFAERNNLAGPRLQDFVKAHWGAKLSSGVAQRTIYLGSAEFPIYSNGVYQTTTNNTITNNPFSSTASKFGNAMAVGQNFVVKGHTDEPCYLMVIMSLVPEANYSSGIDRDFYHFVDNNSQSDLATPLLENVGPQPIYNGELFAGSAEDLGIFGYVDRYSEYKTKMNEVHGQMVLGNSLESFVAQRQFEDVPELGTEFLEIPKSYLNNVFATDNVASSNLGYWYDTYIKYNIVTPLARYSMPSLQDPAYEHGYDVTITRGGSRVD